MEGTAAAVVGAIIGTIGSGVLSFLVFTRNVVTREEVSRMIQVEAPHALQQQMSELNEELQLVRKELSGLRADVARLTGVLETLAGKGR